MMLSKQWWVVCTVETQRRAIPLQWFSQYTQVTNYVRVPKSPPLLRGGTFVEGQLVWLIDWVPGQIVSLPFGVWLQPTPTSVRGWILPGVFTVVYEAESDFESHERVSHLCI